jgi:endonuclease-3 related protein
MQEVDQLRSPIVSHLRVSPLDVYQRLVDHFGLLYGPAARQPWWPVISSDPQLEIIIGAVLVQQTRWETVEDALAHLYEAGLIELAALAKAAPELVATLIFPCAFYRQKAGGLVALANAIRERYGDVATMLRRPTATLRAELLTLPRIGQETADVIMLYAGQHPLFVIGYQHVQQVLMAQLPIDAQLFADFHAQLNELAVRYCLSWPRCDGPPARRVYSRQPGRNSFLDRHDGCPLRPVCGWYQQHRQ